MKKINKEILNTIIRNIHTKKEPCAKYSSLMMQLVYSLSNFFNYTEKIHQLMKLLYGLGQKLI